MTETVHGDLDVPAENLVPQLPSLPFAEGLVALARVLHRHPELAGTIYHVTPALKTHLEMRVYRGMGIAALEAWAALMTDVSTSSYRYDGHVDGELSGLLEGLPVRIVGSIADDAVPEGAGAHEWTLPEEEK